MREEWLSWTKRECEWLKKHYATASWPVMQKKLRGRSVASIRVFANQRLGLLRAPHERLYTKKEDEILRKLYPSASWEELQRRLCRSKFSIAQRARAIGVKRTAPGDRKFWTREEEAYLRKRFPSAPRAEIEKHLGRNWNAICRRASLMRIRRVTAGHVRWTKKEDEILRKHYSLAPKDIILGLLPGRNWHGIVVRSSALGVRRIVKETSRKMIDDILRIAPNGEKMWVP